MTYLNRFIKSLPLGGKDSPYGKNLISVQIVKKLLVTKNFIGENFETKFPTI